MQLSSISMLNIMPGLLCNLSCSHCVNSSGPENRVSMTAEEITELNLFVKKYKPESIYFTGGEPTLYLDIFEKVLSDVNYQPKVTVTTNGLFAKNAETMKMILGRVPFLSEIQLSYDKYHGLKTLGNIPRNLMSYASMSNIDFNISCSVVTPQDIIDAVLLEEEYQCKVVLSKVVLSGRAKKNNLTFQYESFDENVWNEQCPNLDSVTYIANKGYSFCCSNLAFNNDETIGKYTFSSFESMERSDFFKRMKTFTMKELALQAGIEVKSLDPKYSLACNLCEFINDKACPCN
jgi:organic radical activating enzyme